MSKFKTYICCIFYLAFSISFAQTIKQDKFESEDAQEQQEYEKEFTYGINWNTNGGIVGGVDFKFAWQTKSNQLIYNLIGIEIGHVVHPKERPWAGANRFGSSYILGKSTNMFVVRPHIGREWVIFKKAEEEGIQVSGILAAGPSLAYLKPYYVTYQTEYPEVIDGTTTTSYNFETLPFDPSIKDKEIAGGASILRGFDEMKAYLGVHAKASLNFEYGKSGGSVGGIEVGTMFEQFGSKIIIIPEAQNQSFYASLFINLYFGIR
ncbi:MAG: hypothetical protein ACKVOU_04615 [Cytophagales bacterium]